MKLISDKVGNYEIGLCAAVNVVFHIPGSILSHIPYEGLRDAKFSCKQKLLMVQVAVPKEIASSDDENIIRAFLFDSLRQANIIAASYFEKKGIEYSQMNYLALVDAVEKQFNMTT